LSFHTCRRLNSNTDLPSVKLHQSYAVYVTLMYYRSRRHYTSTKSVVISSPHCQTWRSTRHTILVWRVDHVTSSLAHKNNRFDACDIDNFHMNFNISNTTIMFNCRQPCGGIHVINQWVTWPHVFGLTEFFNYRFLRFLTSSRFRKRLLVNRLPFNITTHKYGPYLWAVFRGSAYQPLKISQKSRLVSLMIQATGPAFVSKAEDTENWNPKDIPSEINRN